MKLGIFDSGLGGLIVTQAIHKAMPDLDTIYLGDTLRVPYGSRSQEAIFNFTKRAVTFLFNQGCVLVILACNSASAAALRPLQQEFLPRNHPDRNVLGVIVPTIESAVETNVSRLGLIGTHAIIKSRVYEDELEKLAPQMTIYTQPTPLLVPLVESDGLKWAPDVLKDYLKPLLDSKIQGLLLGCTHYPFLKKEISDIVGEECPLLSQDEIIPEKLKLYLQRHPEYDHKISKSGERVFCVTDLTDHYRFGASLIYGHDIPLEKVVI